MPAKLTGSVQLARGWSGIPTCELMGSRASPYVSGRTRHWLKFKNPAAPAVKREAEEDWRRI